MKKRFQKIMEKGENQRVLITGHSFGGAVAALVAVDIVKENLAKKNKVTLITLGQSMVGDKDFAKAYEKEYGSYFVRKEFVGAYKEQPPFALIRVDIAMKGIRCCVRVALERNIGKNPWKTPEHRSTQLTDDVPFSELIVFYDKHGMQSDGSTGFKICERGKDFDEEGCSGKQTNPLRAINNDEYFRRNITKYGLKCK
ncbi:hypothetical protein ANCCAN_23059 [Ancylostoma caninum]|uniref:Fungal lipase-type domain-containing protein n=1 Tax=Ancylostoma caninum TaxID=29170 RepID=A0A368FI03_ANCCA|nr:hypothetical protein ANCCAN_23059 [Ancylostoma caninum]